MKTTLSILFLILFSACSNREPEVQDSYDLIVLRLVYCQSTPGCKVGAQ